MSSTDPPTGSASSASMRYWRATIRLTLALLAIWLVVGIGGGIVFADFLNRWSIGGFPLGFWIAQQGSILVFVILILVYAIAMNRLEALYRRDRDASRP